MSNDISSDKLPSHESDGPYLVNIDDSLDGTEGFTHVSTLCHSTLTDNCPTEFGEEISGPENKRELAQVWKDRMNNSNIQILDKKRGGIHKKQYNTELGIF